MSRKSGKKSYPKPSIPPTSVQSEPVKLTFFAKLLKEILRRVGRSKTGRAIATALFTAGIILRLSREDADSILSHAYSLFEGSKNKG